MSVEPNPFEPSQQFGVAGVGFEIGEQARDAGPELGPAGHALQQALGTSGGPLGRGQQCRVTADSDHLVAESPPLVGRRVDFAGHRSLPTEPRPCHEPRRNE